MRWIFLVLGTLGMGFSFSVQADSADATVLKCDSPEFTLKLVNTDTGNLFSLAVKGEPTTKYALGAKTRFSFVNDTLVLDFLILQFDDAKAPTKVTFASPATFRLHKESGKCTVSDPKVYEAILKLGTFAIPDDIKGKLFTGNFVGVRFLETTHAASGDFDCTYSYLGVDKKDCHWNSTGRVVSVHFTDDGKARTHEFLADSHTKTLVSASATLSR